jgi:hypothetical protein
VLSYLQPAPFPKHIAYIIWHYGDTEADPITSLWYCLRVGISGNQSFQLQGYIEARIAVSTPKNGEALPVQSCSADVAFTVPQWPPMAANLAIRSSAH